MDYTIRDGNIQDLPAAAKVHRASFPTSLATAMGQRYVEKMLSFFLSSDKTFMYIATDENSRVIGYIGGIIKDGTLTTGSASGMLQHSFNEAVKSILLRPWLLFHKDMRVRYGFMLTNIKKKLTGKASNVITEEQRAVNSAAPSVGLVGMGVYPEYRGKGVGSALFNSGEKKARELNIKQLYFNVLLDNVGAIRIYERNGYTRVKVNSNSLQMTKKL